MEYMVVLHRNGREIETLYWSGSLGETVRLARVVAAECNADFFRLVEFADGACEVFLERAPFQGRG